MAYMAYCPICKCCKAGTCHCTLTPGSKWCNSCNAEMFNFEKEHDKCEEVPSTKKQAPDNSATT